MSNETLTRDEQERYQIALFRWRADMNELGAAQLDSIGQAARADLDRAQAVYFREQADLLEQFRAEVRFDSDDHKTPEGRAKTTEFHLARRASRDRLVAAGGGYANDPSIRRNFVEPTPAELGVTVGG